MVSRLRVPTDSGPAGHSDTPTVARAARLTGALRKFSLGERDLGVSAPETRDNTTTSSGTIFGCVAIYHVIASFPNRRKGSTMVTMTARAP
jgi:hypothetical protein